MTSTSQILSADHLDLLVTAAVRWRILTSRTAAAFSQAESHLVVATCTAAGRLVQQENLAAVRWLSDRGRGRLADRATPEPYTFTEVEHLVPVEVIKACHAAEVMCSSSPGWSASVARRLLVAVATAASHRLEGYSAAPWEWTRPQRRSGPAIAVGAAWRPELPGISWIDTSDLAGRWVDASLVIISTEVAEQLPPDLPRRSGVFLLADREPQDEIWSAIVALDSQALVLFWPTCQPWLADQVSDPSPEFVEHRQDQP